MNSSNTPANNLPRLFGPRALIATALFIHFILASFFWMVSLGLILAVAKLYPVIGSACVMLALSTAVWLTRVAWHRNTWLAALVYFVASIITLPWTVIAILGWIHSNYVGTMQ